MYLSLIVIFLLLLAIMITSIQNSMPLELKFIVWSLQISLRVLILYSSVAGAAIVAIFTVPRMARRYLKVRRLNKELNELKNRNIELERAAMKLQKQEVEES